MGADSAATPPPGMFTFDGEPQQRRIKCPTCAQEHEGVTGFVLRDQSAYAVYFADWYPHASQAWLDVVPRTFAEHEPAGHVTFGRRIGHIPGQEEPACSLAQAAARRSGPALSGARLSPEQARGHPRPSEFWTVTDWLILNDQLLHRHVFHMPPATQSQ